MIGSFVLSEHGNTARMAEIVARGVAEVGIKEVKVYDVAKTAVPAPIMPTCSPT